jgi:chromosome segregation ATPase
MNETTPFSAGSSAQTAEGPVELGVVVSSDAMGVVVEAPFLGQLRAAFDVLDDGSARLSTLTRRGADGREVHIAGTAELARIARLSADLDDSRSWEPRARAAEEILAQSVTHEEGLSAELAAARTALNETETSLRESRSELSVTQTLLAEAKGNVRRLGGELNEARATLEQTQGRLKRTKTDLGAAREEATAKQGAASAELADGRSRLSLEQNRRAGVESERDASRAELAETRARLESTLAARATLETELASVKPLFEGTRSRLARAETARDGALERLKASEEGRSEANTKLKGTRAQLATVTAERDTAQKALDTTSAELVTVRSERDVARSALDAASAELTTVTAQRDAAQSALDATGAELTEVRAALAAAQTAHAQLAETRTSLEQAVDELASTRAHVTELTQTAQVVRGELSGAKQERDDAVLRAGEATQTAAGAQSRAEALGGELAALRVEHARTTSELQDERTSREELVRDLGYIQSQVADLASTKGALVARVGHMTKREEQRRKSTAEFSDVLRTAEVVAADRLIDARRQQARAGKLEAHVKDLEDQVAGLMEQLRDAQTEAAKVAPLTAERDRLKIEIAFFQKQKAAALRAREQGKK